MVTIKLQDMYVDVKAESFRTRVQLPPPPPISTALSRLLRSLRDRYGTGVCDSCAIPGLKRAPAKHPNGMNFVIVPDRISNASGGYLEVYDPHGNIDQSLE